MKVIEIEIYGNEQEFKENEFDVMANYENYECAECVTVKGLAKAKEIAKEMSEIYQVPIKHNY